MSETACQSSALLGIARCVPGTANLAERQREVLHLRAQDKARPQSTFVRYQCAHLLGYSADIKMQSGPTGRLRTGAVTKDKTHGRTPLHCTQCRALPHRNAAPTYDPGHGFWRSMCRPAPRQGMAFSQQTSVSSCRFLNKYFNLLTNIILCWLVQAGGMCVWRRYAHGWQVPFVVV